MGLSIVERQAFKNGEVRKKFEVTICSGKGLGASFVDSLKPSDPITLMLGEEPYPGTLFVKLKKPINLKGLPYPTNNRDEVKILIGYLEDRVVVIKWTKRYPKNLQLISKYYLRSELKLVDGKYSEIFFTSSDLLPNSLEINWLSFLQWAKTTRLANLRRMVIKKLRECHKL